jgi:hypothetical protein
MKNVFWDVARVRTDVSEKRIALQFTVYVLLGSLILSTLKMVRISSSETSIITRTTRCHIPEGDILHLKSYWLLGKFCTAYR